MEEHDFQEWPKIPRLKGQGGVVITEKIDGTNAQVVVPEDDGPIRAGSRTRYLTLEADNFGFAQFVHAHEEAFRKLGPGRHYGEWWGPGIQRGYGLRERVFSLFNTQRWAEVGEITGCDRIRVVPTLYQGDWLPETVETVFGWLLAQGSQASPGFLRPEGIVLFHRASQHMFKYTFEGDHKA